MMESKPLTLRDRNRLRTREELLDAVLALFAEGGLNACSVEAAAKLVGASKTTVYAHFPGGMEEMLRDLYRLVSRRLLENAMLLRDRQSSPQDRIFALAEALLSICSEPRVGRFYMMLSPALSPLLEPVVGEASGEFKQMIASDLLSFDMTAALASSYATLINGSLREAAITVAKEPELRDEFLSTIKDVINSLWP